MSQQRFYRPIVHEVIGKPCITYPARDENPLSEVLSRDKQGAVEEFVGGIITRKSLLFTGRDYLITMPWCLHKKALLDVWAFTKDNVSEWGSSVMTGTFNAQAEPVTDLGTTSGDALIILGNEELLRRRAPSLEAYLQPSDQRWQSLPAECRADVPFYEGETA